MKTTFRNTLSKISGIALLTLSLASCDNAGNSSDPKNVAEEHNDAKFDKAKEKDAQFFVDVADIFMREIKLSELAATQAEAYDIKELGQMLKEDNAKWLKETEALASKKMVTLPTDISQGGRDSYTKISDKHGKDFDRDYPDAIVDLNKDVIEKFEKAATDAQDYETKTWAGKKLVELRNNLDKSMVCRDKYKDLGKDHQPMAKDMRK
jgi:putative membrane protein